MKRLILILALTAVGLSAQAQYFETSAQVNGNSIAILIRPTATITTGWSVIEFFMRNLTVAGDPQFSAATITVNTVDFPGVSIPYNGMNQQGTEVFYTNYWFGVSFSSTTPKTYNGGQVYTLCTITLTNPVLGFGLELVHNESFVPTYLTLTSQGGVDLSTPSPDNKFYGNGALICTCPITTNWGLNHILPLAGVVPVELVTFEAQKLNNRTARLTWSTALETNFAGFEVERGNDSEWVSIGYVDANGNNSEYLLDDGEPLQGINYYRLKIIDRDQSFTWSPIRSVTFTDIEPWLLYPVPTNGWLHLVAGKTSPAHIRVFDALGRLVLEQKAELEKGEILDLDCRSCPAGAATLEVRDEKGELLFSSLIGIVGF